jgi:hypothetical protein
MKVERNEYRMIRPDGYRKGRHQNVRYRVGVRLDGKDALSETLVDATIYRIKNDTHKAGHTRAVKNQR